jgi:O-acetyl-ADP-ribose deacetylase (regulator of RNase III)
MTTKLAQEYQVGTSTVALRVGDILESKAEIIVSSDDDKFSMNGGVSAAILRAGGSSIKEEAQKQIAPRQLGDMIETGHGSLSYKRIYHVVSRFNGRHERPDFETTRACISAAVDNCIEALSRSAYGSIAFPAIGTGYAGHDPADVAAAFAAALGKKLGTVKKPLRVELYIHPGLLTGLLEFLRVFEDKATWLAAPIRDHAVAMVHGIRTDARWYSQVGRFLREADPSINPVPIGYGFFDVVSFLIPSRRIRQRLIDKVAKNLDTMIETKSTRKLSIIAHSFGTFLTAYALLKSPKVKVHRLILCGSIVPKDFDWSKLQSQLDVIDESQHPQACAINDHGWRDIWPVFAQTMTWGYGSSGRFGFQTVLVVDRAHDLSHSEFFKKEFVARYWVPALVHGSIVPNNVDPPMAGYLLLFLTRVQVKYVILAGIAVWLFFRFR